MRKLKWALLVVAVLQAPFACSLWRTRQIAVFIEEAPRRESMESPFQDVRCAIHVHSRQGGHSLGTYPEIFEAAKQSDVQFVFITEHPRQPKILAEIEDPELVVVYGREAELEGGLRVLEDPSGRFRFLTHFQDGELPSGFDGVEIYNIHENAQAGDSWFQRLNFLYHQAYHPELFFFHLWNLDGQRLGQWDRVLAKRAVAAIAGNDAHQNVGVRLETAAGRRLVSVMVDPYRYSFQFVSTHALLSPGVEVSAESVLSALASGSAFVAFERIGDATGFSFHALQSGSPRPMGSRVAAGSDLVFQAPIPSRFLLKRDGRAFRELEGVRFTLENAQPGVYRVEVHPLSPPKLLQNRPWILSNPVFVGVGQD
jgi:hypothetical protein